MTTRPTRQSPAQVHRRPTVRGSLTTLLAALAISALALIGSVVVATPGTAVSPTAKGSAGLTLSTLVVEEGTLSFQIINTTNAPIASTLAIVGIAADGSVIDYGSRPIEPIGPNRQLPVNVPFQVTPRQLTVALTTATGSTTADWPVPGVAAAVLTPGAVPPLPPDPGSSSASLIVFTLVGLFLLLLLWWAAAGHNRRKRRLQERADLIERARLAEKAGEAAAAAAVAAAGVQQSRVVPPPLRPGEPFPPPAGAPVEAITLDLVAAGAVLIGPMPSRAASRQTAASPEMAMAGAPFPPPAADAMVPTDGSAVDTSGTPASDAAVAPGTPFPPPNGAPVG